MAGVLSVVTSGISLAQIVGQVLSAGLKIKELLDEVREAPKAIQELIQQIEVLAPILHDIDSFQSQGLPFLQSSNDSLRAAVLQCQMSLNQLTDVLNELSAQIESCRGPRRKMVAVKVVLKKDLLTRYEKHLLLAVQSLSLAQQSCIL
jgi:hypothetical protein